MKTDHNIAHLHPLIRSILHVHLDYCMRLGQKRAFLQETWRGPELQNKAVADGFSNAGWGKSWHNTTFKSGKPCSLAYHIAIRDEGGKSIEGFGSNKLSEKDIEDYTFIGKIGEALGLVWGGRWKSRDLVHFELRVGPLATVRAALATGDSIVDLRAAKREIT